MPGILDPRFLDRIDSAYAQLQAADPQTAGPAPQSDGGFLSPAFLDRIDTAYMQMEANQRGRYPMPAGQSIGDEPNVQALGQWGQNPLVQKGYEVVRGAAGPLGAVLPQNAGDLAFNPIVRGGHESASRLLQAAAIPLNLATGLDVSGQFAQQPQQVERAYQQKFGKATPWYEQFVTSTVGALTDLATVGKANPTAFLGEMAATTYDSALKQANESGLKDTAEKHAYASIDAAAEIIPEIISYRLGLGPLATMTKKVLKPRALAILASAGPEAAGEMLTQVGQNVNKIVHGITNPDGSQVGVFDGVVMAGAVGGTVGAIAGAPETVKAISGPKSQPAAPPVQTPDWAKPQPAEPPRNQPQPVATPPAAPQPAPAQAPHAPQVPPQEAPAAEAPQAPAQEAPTPLEVPPEPVHNPPPQIVEKGGQQSTLGTLAETQPETLPDEKPAEKPEGKPVDLGRDQQAIEADRKEADELGITGTIERLAMTRMHPDDIASRLMKDHPEAAKAFPGKSAHSNLWRLTQAVRASLGIRGALYEWNRMVGPTWRTPQVAKAPAEPSPIVAQKPPMRSLAEPQPFNTRLIADMEKRKAEEAKPPVPGAQPEMFGGSEAQGKLFNAAPAPKNPAPQPVPTKTESPADIAIEQPTIAGQKELTLEAIPLVKPGAEKRAKAAAKAAKTRRTKDEELNLFRSAQEHGVPVEHLSDYVDAEIEGADQHWENLKELIEPLGIIAPGKRKQLKLGDETVFKDDLDKIRERAEKLHVPFEEVKDAIKHGLPEKPSPANRDLVDRAAKRLAEDLERHGSTEFNPGLFDDISFAKGEFPELETSSSGPTNRDVLEAMLKIEPGALRGTLVPIRDLRKALANAPKERLDAMLFKMAKAGQISLHAHDFPSSLTQAEKDEMLVEKDVPDWRPGPKRNVDVHYIGAAIRVPKGSAYKGASPAVQMTKAQAREEVRKDLGIEPEDVKGTPESIDDIRKTMEHDFDTALLRGRVPEKAKGFYDWATEVGRLVSKAYQDLAIISHEITHHFDNTADIQAQAPADVLAEWESLDYEPDRGDPREGFAEFGRMLLTTDQAPNVAPRAYAWFTQKYLADHPEERAKWAKARRLIDAYRSADPLDRARANMFAYGQRAAPVTTKKAEIQEALKRQLVQQARNWIDDAFLIKKLGREAEAKIGTKDRTKIRDLIEAYSGADEPQAIEALTEGVYSLGEQRRKMYKPLKEVLSPLSAEELEQWSPYLSAVAAKEAREKKAGYNPGISEADQDAIIEAVDKAGLTDKFDKVAKDFRGFHAALVDVLADSGVISQDSAKRIKDSREVYMPRLRIKDMGLRHAVMGGFHDISRSIFGVKNPIKRLGMGSNDPYMDPIEATIIRTMETFNAANHQEMESAFMRLMLPSMGGAKGFGKWVIEVLPKTIMEPARLESLLHGLAKKHEVNGVERAPVLAPEDATRIKNVSRLRRRDITKPLLKWFQNNYGTQDLAALDKATENVPDIADAVAVWKQDFGEKPNEHIKRFYVNGETHLVQYVDGDLYSEVQGLSSRYEASTLGKALSGVLRWYDKLITTPVKLGAVGLNVSFQPVNVIRDYVSFVNQSKETGAWERFYAPIEGLARYGADYVASSLGNKRNPYAELFDAMGGKVSPRLGGRRKAVKHLKAEMLAKTTARKAVAKFAPGNIINSVQDVLSIGESGVRLSEFMGSIHNDGFHFDYKRDSWVKTDTGTTVDALPRRVVTHAAAAANEVTTNFRRKGTYSRVADRVIPFFSANINGTVRGLIGAKELLSGEGKHKRLLGMAMLLTFGGLAWALSHDKDWYKDLDPDMKNRFWFFGLPDGTPFIRIAKPYTYSAFVNTMEGLLDFVHTGSLDRFPEVVKSEFESQMPPGTVRGVKDVAGANIVWDLKMNEDRFGRHIEPLSMVESGLYKQYRSKPYTSETAKFMSKFLSSGKYGLSPVQADYIADQWTGGGFSQVVGTAEGIAKGNVQPETLPVLKRFLLKSDHQATVRDFYQGYDELASAVATAKYLNPGTKRPDAIRQAQLQQWTRYKAILSDIWKADRGKTVAEQRELERFAVGMADFALGHEERDLYPNPLRKSEGKVPEVIEQARIEYVGKLAHVMTESPKRKMGEPFHKFRDRFMLSAVETKWAAQELDRLGYKPIDVAKTLDAQMRKSGHKISVESVGEIIRAMAAK